MSTSIAQTIDLLSKEKNIDSGIIIEAMQEAVKTAARKHYKTNEDLRAQYVISYYPCNDRHDGSFRSVGVVVDHGDNRKLIARTRQGYYAHN